MNATLATVIAAAPHPSLMAGITTGGNVGAATPKRSANAFASGRAIDAGAILGP